MLKRDTRYRRVKVTNRGAFSTASYWLGPDHLLVVEVSGCIERYHRFAYGDIQAVIVRRNRSRLWMNLVLGILIGISGLVGWGIMDGASNQSLGTGEWTGVAICLGVVAGLALLLLQNSIDGPTCACHLRTILHVRALPCLTRWRKAESLLRELTPLILATQNKGGVATAGQSAALPQS